MFWYHNAIVDLIIINAIVKYFIINNIQLINISIINDIYFIHKCAILQVDRGHSHEGAS